MYKIGVIGARDIVVGFLAVGFTAAPASNAMEAELALRRLAEDCAVIYITEDFAEELEDEIAKFNNKPLPAIISIPAQRGTNGYGMNLLRTAQKRAIGADILFKD